LETSIWPINNHNNGMKSAWSASVLWAAILCLTWPTIAETYDLMKRGLDLNVDELHDVFSAWNNDELNGYLMEITGHIFSKADEKSGGRIWWA
jgi:hypothetical protein